jgi:hypothetical protein
VYRSRGLVKRWQDRYGNLLLQEFVPFVLGVNFSDSEEPGEKRQQAHFIFLFFLNISSLMYRFNELMGKGGHTYFIF